jgi:hypothetical protein
MRQNGQKRKIRSGQASEDSSDAEEETDEDQLLLIDSEMKRCVKEV